VLNLVSNAVKNTPPGGSVAVRARALGEDRVELQVADTGMGIRREDQQAVFDRFHRVAGQEERHSGSGIGMALVRELVLEHGGDIELESEPQHGTTVRLTLPRTAAPEDEPAPASPVAERIALEVDTLGSIGPAALPERRADPGNDRALVLVVEDNADMRAYIVALLAGEYDCLEAENGEEAVEMAFEYVPDLVLCDIVLPGLDGFEVSHALKEDERTSHVPIVLLTARHDRDSRLHGWKEKIDGYLTKPFDDDELMLRIANLLAVREILKSRFASRLFEEAIEHNGMARRDREFMARLEATLDRGFADEAFSVEQMAAGVFMGVRQLQRKLKALTGQTPSTLLRAYRLRRARELLQTGMAVGQVADAVGFSSPAYFSTCFKAQFGMPPGEFQESNGETSTQGA
jgi:CheY-like chemotaxis protein